MKRATVFLIVGPSAIALVAALALAAAGAPSSLVQILPVALFFLTFPVAAFAGAVDACLARGSSVSLRALLTAIAGAAAAYALAFGLLHCLFPPSELMFLPLGAAICTGVCSLLAHDYDWQGSAVQANALLQN